MIEFVLVSTNEYDLKKSEIVISGEEAEILLEHQKTIQKFLLKARFNYQIELSKGTHRGREEVLYNKMEAMNELIQSIGTVSKAFIDHRNRLEQERKDKENKQE